MSDDPWAELLEEYWDALENVGSLSDAKSLWQEYLQRMDKLMSSLELLHDLNQARNLLELGPIATEGIKQNVGKRAAKNGGKTANNSSNG